MNGFVDDKLRALLRVPVSATRDGNRMAIAAIAGAVFASPKGRNLITADG